MLSIARRASSSQRTNRPFFETDIAQLIKTHFQEVLDQMKEMQRAQPPEEEEEEEEDGGGGGGWGPGPGRAALGSACAVDLERQWHSALTPVLLAQSDSETVAPLLLAQSDTVL